MQKTRGRKSRETVSLRTANSAKATLTILPKRCIEKHGQYPEAMTHRI
jgi:hypothetical protein